MKNPNANDDGVKKVKNFAAVVYLLLLAFLVGGSYVNQHRQAMDSTTLQKSPKE